MNGKNKIFLIDGMSLVFRAYHALSRLKLKSKKNEPTNAVFAFTNILSSLIEKENPEYIAVVFDSREPTFRHQIFKEYKANREAFPEDLVPQLARIKEILDAMNIKRLEIPGYEADDIIGTIAKRMAQLGWEVYCVTNDKDYFQLVDENIKIYKTGKNFEEGFEIIDRNKVLEKFGVEPERVTDVLALVGDSVDNVPGVLGIGEKTAIPLIQRFGSVENLYQRIDEVEKENLRQKLETNKENATLSKKLVTINTQIDLEINLDELKFTKPNIRKLLEIFYELDFKTLSQKFAERFGDQEVIEERLFQTTEHQTLENVKDKEYILIDSQDKFHSFLEKLKSSKSFAIDLETSSLDKLNCEIVGISFSFHPNQAYYLPVYGEPPKEFTQNPSEQQNKTDSFGSLFDTEETNDQIKNQRTPDEMIFSHEKGFPIAPMISKIKPYLEDTNIGKMGQNIKFDAFILKRYGIDLKPIVFDTMVASYLLNPDEQHNLDYLAKKFLNYSPIPIESLIGNTKKEQVSMRSLLPKDIKDYACEDADLVVKLEKILRDRLVAENLIDLAERIEFPLVEVLTQMECNGVYIDNSTLKVISNQLSEQLENLRRKIIEQAGMEFNIDSPKQLGFVLFEKLKLPVIAKTKTGYSTDVNVLLQLAESYPIAKDILEYRQMTKLLSTYVDALPNYVNPKTKRIHSTFHQTVVSSGRLSSSDPNLQNIPVRSEFGKEIRKAFAAQHPNWKIVSADYSQIELRIVAYFSKDPNLIEAFKNGRDIHSATASLLFEKPIDEITPEMRRVAKTVNFGIIYGLGPYGLSQRLNISRTEAQKIIDNYLNKYPGIKKYAEETIKQTAKLGYAQTLCGRRRYFQNINSQNKTLRSADERAAINHPIQGTAADMMKIAMVEIHKEFKKRKLKTMMLLQIHDELLFECPVEEIEIVKEIITDKMTNALSLGEVPVVVDIGVGESWFDAH